MLRLNKKIEYGVIALLYLHDKEDQVASVREMAAQCGIPETLLSKIMQTMKNQGFVIASYGNQGGYRLNKEIGQINLLELTTLLVGPVQVTECLDPEGACPVKENCTIVSPMQLLNTKIMKLFEQTSLETLAVRKVG